MVANAGSIHVYNCIHGESSCSFRNKITATGTNSRQVNDQFGISVSITEKGWVAGGAHWHSYDLSGGASGFNQGAVWVAY